MKRLVADLGDLADPRVRTEALEVGNLPPETLLTALRDMMTIRQVEERIGDWVTAGLVKCPCHLCIGQEAVSVGVSQVLRATDRVFGNHRSHGHYLALGGDVTALFAEVLGRDTGCSRGMGGSMHLQARSRGFVGSVPIVAGTIPVAAGAALAAKMDGNGDVAVSYMGDGSAEEGVFHETLNMASVMKLPLVFVCENNLFASHMDIMLRQSGNRVARFADAHGVKTWVVDGNDVAAVMAAAREAVGGARAGNGPAFIEAVTYRWRGHVGANADIDVGVHRSADLLAAWQGRDPIRRLTEALVARGIIDQAGLDELDRGLRADLDEAQAAALAAPFPAAAALLDYVYAPAE